MLPGSGECCGVDVWVASGRSVGDPENVNAGGGLHPPRGSLLLPVERYGSETLVLSPELEMVKVPAVATGV